MKSIYKLFIFITIVCLTGSVSILICNYRSPSSISSTRFPVGLPYKVPDTPQITNHVSDLYGKCGPVFCYDDCEYEPFEKADPLYGKDLYVFYIAQITEQYYPDVDPYISLAVLETESNYQPDLTSSAGAVGLMQVIPKYHSKRVEKYGLNDIWDPYTNIICGIDFLNELYHTYGNWNRALLGYNNSVAYVNHVLAKADILRGGNYFGKTTSSNPGSS